MEPTPQPESFGRNAVDPEPLAEAGDRVHLSGRLLCADAGEADAVREHLPEHIRATRQEPGCLSFQVSATAHPLVWAVDEWFVDRPAFEHHQGRVAASKWGAATAGIASEYTITDVASPVHPIHHNPAGESMSITNLEVADGEGTITLRVKDTGGDGAPVVLVHPWPQRLEIWDRQEAALAGAGYRVISYDRAGFGESEPTDSYDYDRLTQHLSGIFEALDLRGVTLVGWSMGGGEVARFAAGPGADRLSSVVFLAAVPPFLLKAADNPAGPVTDESWREGNAFLAQDHDGFLKMITTAFFSVDGEMLVGPEVYDQALVWASTADPNAIAGCQEAFSTTDFRADLAKISVPAAVIHGDSDQMVPFEFSGALTHEALPGSVLRIIGGAPHGLGVTHDEDVNAALLAFIGDVQRRAER